MTTSENHCWKRLDLSSELPNCWGLLWELLKINQPRVRKLPYRS